MSRDIFGKDYITTIFSAESSWTSPSCHSRPAKPKTQNIPVKKHLQEPNPCEQVWMDKPDECLISERVETQLIEDQFQKTLNEVPEICAISSGYNDLIVTGEDARILLDKLENPIIDEELKKSLLEPIKNLKVEF